MVDEFRVSVTEDARMVRMATPVAAAASLFAATAFGTLAFPTAASAVADCDPGALTTCERFSTTGSDQTWTVPTGVTSVSVEVWGAGGGGPGAGWFPQASSGGSGGYTTATMSVYPGQQLKVVVGSPGQFGSATVTYGGGGAGGTGEGSNDGSSGGGMSAILRGSDLLVAAGGGGGASIGSLGVPDGVAAGPGGGATGGQDTAPQSSGRGGTQSAGGAAATGYSIAMCDTDPTAGSKYQGGNGGSIATGPVNSEGGGGGGGGYYGGGGGSCQDNSEVGKQNGPGGGGSGFANGPGVTGGSTQAGTASTGNGQVSQPPGTSSANYVSGLGVGGSDGAGGAGSVVVKYTPATAPTPAANPQIADSCALDYSVMVDASDSVKAAGAVDTVRDALSQFFLSLSGTGSSVRLDQFGTATQSLTPRTKVNPAAIAPDGELTKGVAEYFNPQPPIPAESWGYTGGAWQDPTNYKTYAKTSKGWTNWDGGLQDMNTAELPDVAVFVTDGDPTAFNLDRAGDPHGGAGSKNIAYNTAKGAAEAETLQRAIEAANALKNQGVRIVVVGVGTVFSSTASQDRLKEISGPKLLTDAELAKATSLNQVDVALALEFSSLSALMNNVVDASCAEPTPEPQPEVPQECGLDYGIMLDASDSIKAAGAVNTVRDATTQFLQGLQDSGAHARLGQFGTTAEATTDWTKVTAESVGPNGALAKGVATYYDPQPPMSPDKGYGYLGGNWQDAANWKQYAKVSKGWTNWDAGLRTMRDDPSGQVAVFITDGDPTAFNLNKAGDPNGGKGSSNVGYNTDKDQAKSVTLDRAVEQANRLKSQGVKVVVIGVGKSLDNASSQGRLMKISGPKLVDDAGLSSIDSLNDVDAAVVNDFDKMAKLMRKFAEVPCGPVTRVSVNSNTDPAIGVGETTVLVDGVATNGQVTKVATTCTLNGRELNGRIEDRLCDPVVTGGGKAASAQVVAAAKKKIKVKATPSCNRGLKVGVKIKSKAKGKRATVWKQAWGVKGNGIRCQVRANG